MKSLAQGLIVLWGVNFALLYAYILLHTEALTTILGSFLFTLALPLHIASIPLAAFIVGRLDFYDPLQKDLKSES